MLIMVIISISIPMCTYATDDFDTEWESMSQSIAEESRRMEQEISSKAVEQSKRQQENEKFGNSISKKYDELSSSMAAAQSSRAQENKEWSSSIAQSIEENERKEKKTLSILIPLFILFIIGIIAINVVIYLKALKENKSAKKTFMPFQPVSSDNENHTPQNTLQKVEGKCMYCGKDISSDSEFCNHCGKKQVEEYVKVFNRYNMNNDEFIASINSWLASNPKIANVKCEFNMRTGYGFLVNKYLLDSVALKYELFKNNNENQYAIVELKKFGFYQKSSDALLEEWKANNPNAVVLKRSGGRHSRGDEGHELFWGIGANNNTQLFVFFKFKRNQ